MPTILIENGFRLFFYADEGFEPAHVHIEFQGGIAKFWLNPVSLANNFGLNGAEVRRAALLAEKHAALIQEKWNEFFSKKS